jgi:hypothetical protein
MTPEGNDIILDAGQDNNQDFQFASESASKSYLLSLTKAVNWQYDRVNRQLRDRLFAALEEFHR